MWMDLFFSVNELSSADSEGGSQQIVSLAVYSEHIFSSSMEGNEAKPVICRSVPSERALRL